MLIAYVGKERCDIVYYLSKIAVALNKRTLLVDNSICGDLYRSLTDGTDQVKEINNLTVARNLYITDSEINNFDITFLYNGMSAFNRPYAVRPDHLYVASALNKLELLDAAKALNSIGFLDNPCENIYLVIRDVVARKYSLQAAAQSIGIIPSAGYVIPLNETDSLKYEMLVNNGTVKIKRVSSDVSEILNDVMVNIFKMDKKSISKAMRKL